ncbi:hypothetical protein [Nocardioides lijunqiniae]|nr:hypothetical protein [Nocardioides lijunqiniae]
MTDTTPKPKPDETPEPTTDSWNVSDSANELGVDAFEAVEDERNGVRFGR